MSKKAQNQTENKTQDQTQESPVDDKPETSVWTPTNTNGVGIHENKLSLCGKVSDLYIHTGYADSDSSTWSKGLNGELACKDNHFSRAILPFGNQEVLALVEMDGTVRHFTTLQLLGYIPKDAEDYKATLKNKSNLTGGINANFGRASEENKKESFSWQFITEFNFKMPTKLPRKPLNAAYTGTEFKKDCNSLYLYLSDLDSPWRMLPAKDGKSVDFV